MRPITAALVVCLTLLPAACNKKPASSTAAAAAASGLVEPGPAYNTSVESNIKFLADYAAQKGVVKTGDGLLYRVIKAGNGKTPLTTDDQVTVLYKGQLIDGKTFDQTTPQNPADPESGPRTFRAGDLIPAWIESLAHMKEGDEWEIVAPYQLAYGEDGHPPVIPAKQTLVFHMSLLKVEQAK